MSVFLQPIYTQTVGSGGTSSITFNSIPQTFTDLKVVVSARGTSSATTNEVYFIVNSDSSTVYSQTYLNGNGSAAASSRFTGYGGFVVNYIPAATATANTFSNSEYYIPNYTGANFKQIIADLTSENNATAANLFLYADLYRSTSPVTSLTFAAGGGVLAQYSTFTLYGITKG